MATDPPEQISHQNSTDSTTLTNMDCHNFCEEGEKGLSMCGRGGWCWISLIDFPVCGSLSGLCDVYLIYE